ncbi:30S ribosomal protein S20 [Candidatus Peregrinibacteria bacterium]|jgi:small subunit ribosomal protein S20|nr:30S ribosomal protein S20 [Candidatus Peregrinibacteria bacterium]MBT7736133.1 30S ribosomal protein S20 [Candidatus Peregrinibacteria bacterium]
MPILKSAKKRVRQNAKKRARNFPVRSELKTLFKQQLDNIKDGKVKETVEFMPKVYSIIDMAVKKNIIHKNNAARKKSRLAKGLNDMQPKGAGATAVEKKEEKKEEKEKK